ncbi:MAG: hypothetical protein C4583_03330 [Anaerolineaceae bacterium]|nr:MAG: hypothetical protein C4583_03330 [Anaerolineaceae bacterium]
MTRSAAQSRLDGKSVTVVGSGPGVLDNEPGFVDSHDVVIRVNNYKLSHAAGFRTTVFYSFFGVSIRKTREELIRDGVTLCWSKVPNAHAIESEWHRRNNKMIGVDYRPHYLRRKYWWFCDTAVPTVEEFLAPFEILGKRQPTTGFAALFDVFEARPKSVHVTGFDFFSSKIHNVDESWSEKNLDDPFRHDPYREMMWLKERIARGNIPTSFDDRLTRLLGL